MEITSKQRAFLRSLSNDLEVILTVGKAGVTDTLISQADGALKKREILKGSVLETAPGDVREMAELIARETNSVLVMTIGFKFILYRQNENKDDRVITLPNVRKNI